MPAAASTSPASTIGSRPRPRALARSEAAPAQGTSRSSSTLSIAMTAPMAVRWSPSASRTSERDERAEERSGDAGEESAQADEQQRAVRRPRRTHRLRYVEHHLGPTISAGWYRWIHSGHFILPRRHESSERGWMPRRSHI